MSVTDAAQTQVTPADLATFTRQLGAMLDAGIDVLRALRISSEHSGNKAIIAATRSIRMALEDGREFHEAILSHPELFDAFYVEMSRQGEKDGLLGRALLSVADYLDRLAQNAAPAPTATAGSTGMVVHSVHPPVLIILVILGVQALGAAVLWGVGAAQPEMLPATWLPALVAFWAGVCLLSGAWVLYRLRHPQPEVPTLAVQPPAPLPPKSVARKAAETEGIVRSALQEQQEETDANLRLSRVQPNGERGLPYTNGKPKPEVGKSSEGDPFEAGGDTPRFDL